MNDPRTLALIVGVLALLTIVTAVGQFLRRHPDRGLDPAAVRSFNSRIRGWWIMCTVLAAAFWLGTTATVVLFGLVSFWALREFITLTPTRLGDHRALFWVFFAFTPAHYVLVGYDRYDIFSVFLPLYGTLFVLARVAIAGDSKRFLERTAKIQAGLMVCVYCLSFAAALLQLPVPTADNAAPPLPATANFRLLFFLILLVQFADCMQYVWSRMLGRRLVAASVSSNRTREGLLGSAVRTTQLASALCGAAPHYQPWQAALAGLLVTLVRLSGAWTSA